MKLKEVQDRLFELLCLIDEICRKEGVTYFLDGGTEIGCVREKDIIPWDDDADIKMKWSEYPAFRDAMRKHLPEGILVVEPEDFSPLFYDFFIRIVDTRYLRRKVTEADRAYRNMENYLCVDVSVHFHIPEQPLRQKIALGRIKLLIEELFMLIREKNGGKAVLAECALLLRPEGIQIITRDEGGLFDIAEEDVTVTSIAAFAVSGYMEKMGLNKRYLTTMSFNRSSFLIKTRAD